MLGQKVQQPPHGQLHAQGLVHGLRPLGGDALDLGQALGLLLDHGEHICPEGVEEPPGGHAAHALHGPGHEVL